MAPLYGRGYMGERIMQAVPFNRGNKLTMISAISFEKVEAALYGEWAADGRIFLTFIEKCLCPVLRKDHVVVMDNVAFHKVSGIKEAIESVGAKLIYLPPYSPDLSPIEPMWGKIKNCLRKEAAHTLKKFALAISRAFSSIESTDLANWYQHCGY